MKKCPYCGAEIHDEASFCPHCTRNIKERENPHPPRRLSWRARWGIGVLLAAAVLVLAVWLYTRPRTYESGTAEVFYTDKDGKYQVCIAWADTPFSPLEQRRTTREVGSEGRYPVLLYVLHAESDAVATRAFLDKVDHFSAEIVRADEPYHITCTQPQFMPSYVQDATAITFIDFCPSEAGDWSAELVVSMHLKNGDTIRVHQEQLCHTIPTYTYTSEDAPLDTLEDLQALIAEISETVEEEAVVNIILPPVTYEGTLTIDTRDVNLTGSEDGAGHRTTFTGPVQVVIPRSVIVGALMYFEGIDFIGSGDGVGVSSINQLFLTDCRIAGWRTGVLAYGGELTHSWTNADECVFEDNIVGFHFYLTPGPNLGTVTDSRFESNLFRNNETAVLLESTGTGVSVKFPDCRFVHNGTDIDNRCQQELDLEGAVFE